MRILICGSRNWKDAEIIRKAMLRFPPDTVIISGGASGADAIAERLAKEMNFKSEVYPADWTKFGRAAGPIRNKRMLDEGKPWAVYAFYNPKKSKGTRSMVLLAHQANIDVIEYWDNEI